MASETDQPMIAELGGPEVPAGLVLSGGGARGAFQVGVWKVLLEEAGGLGRVPEVISGTSCGAINGALIAAGLSPDDMLQFWFGVADDPPVTANEVFFQGLHEAITRLAKRPLTGVGLRSRRGRILRKLIKRHAPWRRGALDAMIVAYWLTARFGAVSRILGEIQTSYLFDVSPLEEHLRRAIGARSLKQTSIRLAINTVDVKKGTVVRIVNHPPQKHPKASTSHYHYHPEITFDMILASAAIPLIFNPVRVGELTLWDGGLLVNSPLAPAVALGAQQIIPVLVTAESPNGPNRLALDTFGRGVERLVDTFLENAYRADRKLLLDRNELASRFGDNDLSVVELYRAIRPISENLFNAGSYLFFEREALAAMFESGKEAARQWLRRGPRLDSRDIPN